MIEGVIEGVIEVIEVTTSIICKIHRPVDIVVERLYGLEQFCHALHKTRLENEIIVEVSDQ